MTLLCRIINFQILTVVLGQENSSLIWRKWFGFLFNGISIFVGYLMLKPSLLKNSSDIIKPIAGGINAFMPFLGYEFEKKRKSVTVVRTGLRRCHCPER